MSSDVTVPLVLRPAQALLHEQDDEYSAEGADSVEKIYNFLRAQKKKDDEEQQYKDAVNAAVVGAVLIASFAFAGFVLPPDGYKDALAPPGGDDAGLADANASTSKHHALIFFVYSNALAFCLSLTTTIISFGSVPQSAACWRLRWEAISVLVWLAALASTVAFLAAGFISFGSAGLERHWAAAGAIAAVTLGAPIILQSISLAGALRTNTVPKPLCF